MGCYINHYRSSIGYFKGGMNGASLYCNFRKGICIIEYIKYLVHLMFYIDDELVVLHSDGIIKI